EGLVRRTTTEQQHNGKAGEGKQENYGGQSGHGPCQGRTVNQAEPLPWAEIQALPGFEPKVGNCIEPGQKNTRGEGTVENDMGRQNAAKPEDGPAEGETERGQEVIDPAGTTPYGQKPKSHHQARCDDGGSEQPGQQISPGKMQPVQCPCQSHANGKRENCRQAGLNGRHAHKM